MNLTPEGPRMAISAPPLSDIYPALSSVQQLLAGLNPGLLPMQFPADTTMFSENEPCLGFPLVLEGEIRVSRRSGDGRSLELYRVVPGELCLASSASLFRSQPLAAHGVTTRPTTLLMIPADVFQRWLETPGFRNEVLGLFAERMADLTSLVDALAFHKLDRRLASALLGHGPLLQVSHQSLADGLGTVREIVTRLLHRFENAGWVSLGRGHIQILNGAALRELASA
jgi:CRP/FNR family transcriptional regulator, anaerobic regulatory protein